MSGSILKQKREELGLDIKEISALLKIKLEYLSAIEDDLFERLPAPVYTIGYIRSYSKYLKVDPADIISLYSKQMPPPKTDTTIMPVILDNDRKKPKTLYIAAAILAIAAGLFVYFKMPYTATDKKQAGTTIETPRNNLAMPVKTERKQDGKIHDEIKHAEKKTDADKPVPATAADSRAQAEKKPVAPAPADTKTSAPMVSSGDQALHRLSIKAVDLSWVSVKFRNGKYEEVTMKPGESKEWSFLEGASLKTGNAGGIQVIIDGKDMGPVGTKGQVVVLTFPLATAPAY